MLVEPFEDSIIHRFDSAGYEQAARVAQRHQLRACCSKCFNLDGDVVGQFAEIRDAAPQRSSAHAWDR